MEGDQIDTTRASGESGTPHTAAGSTTGKNADATVAGGTELTMDAGAAVDGGTVDTDMLLMAVDVDGDDIPDIVMVESLESAPTGSPPGTDLGSDMVGGDTGAGAVSAVALTGTSDPVYDLVSVLYHALQGAETTVAYADDAAYTGDAELAQFFAEIQAQDRDRATRAKALLRTYLATE